MKEKLMSKVEKVDNLVKKILLPLVSVILAIFIVFMLFLDEVPGRIKFVAITYSVAVLGLIVILKYSKEILKAGLRSVTWESFLLWAGSLPVMVGVLGGIIALQLIEGIDKASVCIYSIMFFSVVAAGIWFWPKIKCAEDNVTELDLYSSAYVFLLTLLSIGVDFTEDKIPLTGCFFVYFTLQLLIKQKACKKKNESCMGTEEVEASDVISPNILRDEDMVVVNFKEGNEFETVELSDKE